MSIFSQPSGYNNFDITREDDIVEITIDSTSRMNGINIELVNEFKEISTGLREDESIHSVTLTGNGDTFSVGADLSQLDGDASDSTLMRRLAGTLHESIENLLRMQAPLITAVDGVAAGAGFSLSLIGDIVLVSDDARFEFAYPRIGLTADGGSTFLLPRLVGLRKAREIVLLDEPISPTEALNLGLATETVASERFEERKRDLAEDLADGPTKSYGMTRRLLVDSFERELEGQLAAETEAMASATKTGDYQRGYKAFFDDGDPEFEGK